MVVERCHHADVTGEWDGVGCSSQKVIHRTSFVPFEVRVADVTDVVERNDLRDRFGHERKPLPPARVEDHRLIVNDEVLAEIEPVRDGVDPQGSIDAVNARCNLVNSCS